MRRIMAVGAMLVLALGTGALTAGCGKSDTPSSAASASPTSSPTVDVAANTKQVCDEVKQLNADSTKKVSDAIARAIAAGAKGDEAAAKKAVDEANATTTDWVAKLKAASAKAANPDLAKALNDIAAQVEKLLSEDATTEQMTKTVQEASATLSKYCA